MEKRNNRSKVQWLNAVHTSSSVLAMTNIGLWVEPESTLLRRRGLTMARYQGSTLYMPAAHSR